MGTAPTLYLLDYTDNTMNTRVKVHIEIYIYIYVRMYVCVCIALHMTPNIDCYRVGAVLYHLVQFVGDVLGFGLFVLQGSQAF